MFARFSFCKPMFPLLLSRAASHRLVCTQSLALLRSVMGRAETDWTEECFGLLVCMLLCFYVFARVVECSPQLQKRLLCMIAMLGFCLDAGWFVWRQWRFRSGFQALHSSGWLLNSIILIWIQDDSRDLSRWDFSLLSGLSPWAICVDRLQQAFVDFVADVCLEISMLSAFVRPCSLSTFNGIIKCKLTWRLLIYQGLPKGCMFLFNCYNCTNPFSLHAIIHSCSHPLYSTSLIQLRSRGPGLAIEAGGSRRARWFSESAVWCCTSLLLLRNIFVLVECQQKGHSRIESHT